jgi:hypothetical protein
MKITTENWEQILKFWGDGSHATASPNMPYCIFGTVDEDGSPRMAPYSSLILGKDRQGFYFDEFSSHLSRNLDRHQKIGVLLLTTKKWFWMKAVLSGRFNHAPGIRLMGTVGEKRAATDREIDAFKKPLRSLKVFRGYQPLWGIMKHGRDIHFDSFETVKCGSMVYKHPV